MKIIAIIVVLLNAIYIIYLDNKVHDLEEKLHREKCLHKNNKLRKKD